MKSASLLFVITIFAIYLVSCDDDFICENGEGIIIEKTIDLSSLRGFEVTGRTKVNFIQGSSQLITVRGHENIINLLKYDIKSKVWKIGYSKCVRNSDELEITITLPRVETMRVSGSGDINIADRIDFNHLDMSISGSGKIRGEGIFGEDLNADISGSGKLELSGNVKDTNFDISGSGDIHAFDLITSDCDIKVSGSGKADVNVSDHLNVKITGSGKVKYKGNPHITTKISGSGKVETVN